MENNWHILIVDDNRSIHDQLSGELRNAGFEVTNLYDGRSALDFIEREGLPHLAVIDYRLPDRDLDGVALAKKLFTRNLPIIVVTAYDTVELALESLRVADDYVRKPFHPPEMVARIRRVLSRIANFNYARKPLVHVDERVQVDYTGNFLIVDGEQIALTPIESRLLHTLMQHKGRVVDGKTLIARVWNSDTIYEDTLRVHIHRLRSKLEVNPRKPKYILTERGIGYSFHSSAS
jgi:DNA-binding response OmpR family regulator